MFNAKANPYFALVNQWPNYILQAAGDKLSQAEEILLRQQVEQFKKIVLEFGSGSGAHLVELARRDSTTLHIGFEFRYKRLFKTAEKADQFKLQNILVVKLDAISALDLFKAESIEAIYINFPDPWDKRRWLKHRLINENSLIGIANLLKQGGLFSYKSDHRAYFESALELIAKNGAFQNEFVTFDLYSSEFLTSNISTEFEKLFVSQKLAICKLQARKKNGLK